MASARLRFRRHLALCALLLLLAAHADWLTTGAGVRSARVAAAAEQSDGNNIKQQERSLMNDDDEDQLELASYLRERLGGLLPPLQLNLTVNKARREFETGQVDGEIEDYYNEQYPANMTVEGLQLMAVKAALRTAPMPVHNSWGYERPEELEVSSWPVGDHGRCSAHLRQLEARLESLEAREGSPELWRDLLFARYLDTFGRVPSDLLRGATKWYGSHAGCLDTRLGADPQLGGTKRIKFRYCMVALRSRNWPQAAAAPSSAPPKSNTSSALDRSNWIDYGVGTDFNLQNFFFRLGVCLPEACNSQDLEPNRAAIERLVRYNLAPPFNRDPYLVADLYCLPDERSPLRKLPWSGWLLLLASAAWLTLIGWATAIHLNVERFYRRTVRDIRQSQRGVERATKSTDNNERESDFLGLKLRWIRLNVYLWDRSRSLVPGLDLVDCLSLYSNWLKYTRRMKVAVAELHAEEQRRERMRLREDRLQRRHKEGAGAVVDSSEQALEAGEDLEEELEGERREKLVDTSSLDALKVVALLWIIAGHCVFYLGSTISNGAILKLYARQVPGYLLANGAIYITEIFFVITGCLTSYLAFKYNSRRIPANLSAFRSGAEDEPEAKVDSEEKPRVYLESRLFRLRFWLMIIANRYLRIAPTYLVVYAFIKLVSLYWGGSGQMWDYSVSPNSFRRRCQQESWWPVLTLTTNFLNIYDHCIVGGWYLSVDMQFMIMAVPMLLVLGRSLRASKSSAIKNNKDHENNQLTFIGGGASKDNDANYNNSNHKLQVKVEPRRLLAGYALIVACSAASFLVSVAYGISQAKVDLSLIVKFVPHVVAVLSSSLNMYTNSVFRFRTFGLGLLVGHLLYLYEFGQIRLPRPLQRHGAKLTSLIFLLGLFVLCLPVLYPKGKIVLSHDMTALLMVLSASGVDLFLCTMIFFVCIGKAPKAALFLLNSPFWSLLSSLSLCAFLVHTEIIILLTSQLNPPPAAQYSLLLFVFSAVLVLTYLLALGLYLCFELPFSRLLESIMRKYLGGSRAARSDYVDAAAVQPPAPPSAPSTPAAAST